MNRIGEIFGNRAMTGEEFMSALEERGLCLSDREEDIEARLSEEKERHAAELAGVRAGSAIQLELMRNCAYNPTLAARALSVEGMAGDESELAREAKVRVEMLKRAEPYLFDNGGGKYETVSTGAPHGGSGTDHDSMSDREYYSTVARI